MSESNRPRYAGSTITSPANERIRFVRSLNRTSTRRLERVFLVEGARLIEDALDSGATPDMVLVEPDHLARTPRGAALLARLSAFRCWPITESVAKALSDTVTPQGVFAIFPIPTLPAQPIAGPIVLILDHLRDPGNAGTLLRSADASGVARTVAFVDSVDAYAPKVVRAAMGAHFRLTILEDLHWNGLLPLLGDRPRRLAAARGGTPYDRVDWTRDCALVIGGEAEGAGSEAMAVANEHITIPMSGPAESLNAAMAGTVLLFDAARVRRQAGGGAT
ncbi:MAG: TrmH family RNA methyltransferase [Chloroflexota bacterium]